MPKVVWKRGAKLTTLALGCKSDVERDSVPNYSIPGQEMELTSSMISALKKVHGEDIFEKPKGGPKLKEEKE